MVSPGARVKIRAKTSLVFNTGSTCLTLYGSAAVIMTSSRQLSNRHQRPPHRRLRYPMAMSALDQKQTSEHNWIMSALPPKADIGTQSRNVRFVPKADSCTAQLTVKSSHTSRGSCQISPPKLVAHFCFFKGNVDPIGSSGQGYRPRAEHATGFSRLL